MEEEKRKEEPKKRNRQKVNRIRETIDKDSGVTSLSFILYK